MSQSQINQLQPAPRLCKDCRHCLPHESGDWPLARCSMEPLTSLVSGETSNGFCDLTRRDQMSCGPDARFFQPKDQ